MTAAMTAAARVKVTWRKDPSTPEPPKWHILKDGVEVAEASGDGHAVSQCRELHESAPTARLDLRHAVTGMTRAWHPEYPAARSLGLWEDVIRQVGGETGVRVQSEIAHTVGRRVWRSFCICASPGRAFQIL